MSIPAYKGAKSDGYSGDVLIDALMWIGDYQSWKANRTRVENELKAGTNKASNIFNGAAGTVSKAAETVIDSTKVFTWIYQNWQLSIVGAIAAIILVKRL